MNTHAVPQEIMSVDFKLFGNFLSLREFLFIAIGLALAWFFWFLMQKGILPGLIAVPISFVIGGGGILIGLVPINDQPLDRWIIAFFTAINRPTQRVWRKIGYQPNIATSDSILTKDYVVTPPIQTQGVFVSAPLTKPQNRQVDSSTIAVERAETQDISQIDASFKEVEQSPYDIQAENAGGSIDTELLRAQSYVSPTAALSDVITFEPATAAVQTQQTQDYPQEPQETPKIAGTIQLSQQQPQNAVLSGSAVSQQSQLSDGQFPPGITVLPQIQTTTPTVESTTDDIPHPPAPPPPPPPPPQRAVQVIVIDDNTIGDFATSIPGLEEKPNTINIVVKDSNGLIMPGVVCVIKNAHGDPVRAAISNILGQILNNIPLKDGMYKVSLTKQGYLFPEVTRTLTGKVYPSIEIKSL